MEEKKNKKIIIIFLTVCDKIPDEQNPYYEPSTEAKNLELKNLHILNFKIEDYEIDEGDFSGESDNESKTKKYKTKIVLCFNVSDLEKIKKFARKYQKCNCHDDFYIIIQMTDKIYVGRDIDLDLRDNTLTIFQITEITKEQFKK